MRILALIFMTASISFASADDSDATILLDFRDQDRDTNWTTANDGVMGGLSEGGPEFLENSLLFSGTLSLKNNGGFSSIRRLIDLDLSEYSGLVIRVRGDGRTYQARMHTDARHRGDAVAYSGEFTTEKGAWVERKIPFDTLRQSYRGRTLEDYPFDPGRVESVGFLIADKKAGPFRLKVEWIAAY